MLVCRLRVAGYVGDAGDAMTVELYEGSVANNRKFSTTDNDNDRRSTSNCATNKDGGWWMDSCSASCLMCEPDEAEWETLRFT